jgi:uncharacterized protein (DUF1778 family)
VRMARIYGKRAKTNRTYRLNIRLTEQERLNLHAIAENTGKTVSDLVRETVLQITERSKRVKSLLSSYHASSVRVFSELDRNRNGSGLTGQNSMNGGKVARVHVSAEETSARESSISRKTGHLAKCKCVECENLRSLFRLADGRPQAKPPRRRTPLIQ